MPCSNCINSICQGLCRKVKESVPVSPYYLGEPSTERDTDLLIGNEDQVLLIGEQRYDAPSTGWTHALIHRYCVAFENRYGADSLDAIYIGDIRVGGTNPGATEIYAVNLH